MGAVWQNWQGKTMNGTSQIDRGGPLLLGALLKPDMITEATRNARAAVDGFASDSGSKVGDPAANQGIFAILPPDQGGDAREPGEIGGGNFAADSALMKIVRVVTTVQYYLDK